jgi:phage terminase small subunit
MRHMPIDAMRERDSVQAQGREVMTRPLTPKQEAFCREYLIDLNGTQAAIRAGYSIKGAHVQAAQLLSNPKVQEFANKLKTERAERTEITSDRVLKEIGRLAFADIRSVFHESGQLLPVHMLPPDVAASIASIEVVTSKVPGGEPVDVEHTAKIKFWDKRGSLELLGRHLKMFTDKLEVEVRDSLAERLERVRAKRAQKTNN